MKKVRVAVVGATGVVGQQMLRVLEERNFPVSELKALATESSDSGELAKSKGRVVKFQGRDHVVEGATPEAFEGCQIALFAAGPVVQTLGPEAAKRGAVVIDNSSAFRMDPEVPLVVPEVNPEDVKLHKGIIANPNCSTIIMVVPLKPLHDAARIKRVVISTYQAVSGAGRAGLEELDKQVRAFAAGEPLVVEAFAHQIAFNLIPHIDVFKEQDYTKEELKMVFETQKIMHEPEMKVSPTAVRVPVIRSHSESINIETEKKLTAAEAREILSKAPGVIVQDDPASKTYPMPLFTSHKDEVFVGRIRVDPTVENGLNLWVAADQIRKGAATNAVQIGELLLKYELL